MRAYYDLSCKPATYDFVTFLVSAKTLGATEVVFDLSKGFQGKKFTPEIARLMYENVLIPACELYEIPFSEGTSGDFTPGYKQDFLIQVFKEKGYIEKPKVKVSSGPKYTVTLRESIRNNHRDSNKRAWLKFAEKIGAEVIEDAYLKPISLIERYKKYAFAEMNYSVVNGPSVLCYYSDCPYVSFSQKSCWNDWCPTITKGFQFPWRNENQEIVWKDDTEENINAVCP